ncbi:hypothetical protein P280DRAFT_491889 [Massarina eburnea CBS 473.64]|uniref:FAD/NAD(P)-binding domain-containing protein n=1 Tax=Massarina eburnea CBS 473.64 TaxID=1395130 RepID=A0A6A6RRU2_9PLEO|nr:hypothetical protein P280DRAFT_491889 [Massarina eburnea CBS 473.64]
MALRLAIVDALIIGGGPVGLATALALAHTLSTAVVFNSSKCRNKGITHMRSVLLQDYFNLAQFRLITREQITLRYETVWLENKKITYAVKNPWERITTKGLKSKTGYRENWPQHICQCLACDGFEQRGTEHGTIFTNDPANYSLVVQQQCRVAKALGASIDEREIKRVINNGLVHTEGVTIEFSEGESVTLDLIEQLGLECTETPFGPIVKVANSIFNSISEAGVFVVGDTISMIKQAVTGVGMELKTEKMEATLKMLGEEKV